MSIISYAWLFLLNPRLEMVLKHKVIYFLKLFITIGLTLSASVSGALEFTGMFVSNQYVKDESAAARNAAFATGMEGVLSRLCLDPTAAKSQAAKKIRDNISRYVLGYSYTNMDGKYLLSINYSGTAVKQTLHENGVPYLSEQRPAVVFWVALDNLSNSTSAWLGEHDSRLISKLENYGEGYGLPVVVPLFDFQDKRLLKEKEELEQSGGFLELSRSRYNTDVVVSGNISEFAGQWKGKGTIYSGTNKDDWTVLEDTLDEALSSLVGQSAKVLLDNYAVGKNASSDGDQANNDRLVVEVIGLNSLTKYQEVVSYLGSLPGIISAQPEGIDEDRVIFNIRHKNAEKALLRALRLDKSLVEVAQDGADIEPRKYIFKVI